MSSVAGLILGLIEPLELNRPAASFSVDQAVAVCSHEASTLIRNALPGVQSSIERSQISVTLSLQVNMVIRRECDESRGWYAVNSHAFDNSSAQIQFDPFAIGARLSRMDQNPDAIRCDRQFQIARGTR